MRIRAGIIRALGGTPVPSGRYGGPRSQAGATYVGDLNDPELIDHLRGHESASGAHVSDRTALRIAVAWRCVSVISGLVSTLPFDLYERVDENTRRPAVDNPLRDVLTRKPNSWQTPSEFRRMLQAQLLLHGYGAALKVRSGKRIVALIPMRPGSLSAEMMADYTLRYTYTAINGYQMTLAQDDVFYLRGLTLDGFTPLSVLSYAREAMGTAISTDKAGAKLMRNGSFIGGTFEHPGTLSDAAYERLKSDLNDDYSGAENTGKRIILEEGMKLGQNAGFSARDLQFLELKDFSRSEVGMFFGVPPHLYGDTTKATSWGSGIEQQNIGFLQYTMQNWLTTWEEAANRDLTDDPRLYTRFDVNGMLRTDVKTQNEAFALALGSGGGQGWMTANEVRAKTELKPSSDPNDDKIPGRAGQPVATANGGK